VTVLRALRAAFARDGVTLVAPFDLTLGPGETASLGEPTALAASIAARLCAAIVKPTTGIVYVGDFESRLQPPQCKRLVGFVDADGFAGDAHAFHCETAFRAEVWGLDARASHARAQQVVAALGPGDERHERYARAVALALVADVAAIVLDQPTPRIVDAVRAFAPLPALVITQVVVAQTPARAGSREPAAT
jgi:ABC-type Na+ transport system ATPase subunit NatA